MRVVPYKFDNNLIDGSGDFTAYFTGEDNDIFAQSDPDYTPNISGLDPELNGAIVKENLMTLLVDISGTADTNAAHDTLASYFDPYGNLDGMRRLLVKDTLGTVTTQWYKDCLVIGPGKAKGRTIQFKLAPDSNVWTENTQHTESAWTVTTSGTTTTLDINKGNTDAYPIFEITPGATRPGSTFRYRRFVETYNYTLQTAPNYKIDLTNTNGSSTGGFDTRVAAGAGRNIADSDNSVDVNGTFDSDDLTINFNGLVGVIPTSGLLYNATTGEQIFYTSKTGSALTIAPSGMNTATGTGRGMGGTTADAMTTGQKLYLSKILVNCDDVRVLRGNGNGSIAEIPRWIYPLNSQRSRIWISQAYLQRTKGTLATEVDDNDIIFEIENIQNPQNIDTTDGLMLIEGEVIPYATMTVSANKTARTINASRGGRDTTAATHHEGVTVWFIPDIRVYYGRANSRTPVQNDLYKPQFDLDSTNASHVYSTFWSRTFGAGSNWVPRSGNPLGVAPPITFTSDNDWENTDPVDPAVVIGVSCLMQGDVASWQLYEPLGFTSVTWTTIDRHFLPANRGFLQVSRNTSDYESTAVAATTLTLATTASATTTPTAGYGYYARLLLQNNTSSTFPKRAGINVETVTVPISTATTSDYHGKPYVGWGDEVAIGYDIDAILKNETTDEWLIINAQIDLGYTLTINTNAKTCIYNKDGSNMYTAIRKNQVRNTWLRAEPGVNTYSYTEDNPNVSIVIKWRGRHL